MKWKSNFLQGNSNSLATIDVAAGYVGVQSYIPFINGSLLLINTYSSPVLAYFLFIYYSILEHPYKWVFRSFKLIFEKFILRYVKVIHIFLVFMK